MQEIQTIRLHDLVLWTENPRDPIDSTASNQDIVDQAINDRLTRWQLNRLAESMGDHYDFSELPTVVMHGRTPVVYDGNRRVILGLLQHRLVNGYDRVNAELPDYPDSIPCNVCDKETALQNVYRKHYDSGSWAPLERDIFVNKHLGYPKTHFLLFDEATGLISSNPVLNVRFVKEEVFNRDSLTRLGFSVDEHGLQTVHGSDVADRILQDLADKVAAKVISTRNNRGKVLEVLDPENQKIVTEALAGSSGGEQESGFKSYSKKKTKKKSKKKTQRRRRSTRPELFGGPLYLVIGDVSNLYRDICDLYVFYLNNKSHLTDRFTALLRMALRLLAETAAEQERGITAYLDKHYESAKKQLSKDEKTTLSSQNVDRNTIERLLHIGAHNYSAASNIEQTMAISLILGKMLEKSHGKEDE